MTSPIASLTDLANLIGVTLEELQPLAVLPYRHFEVAKRDGSPRPIAEPPRALKQAQRIILREFWEGFPTHDAAHSVVGRSALTNARAHSQATWIMRLDVRDFFPSIRAPRIVNFLTGGGMARDAAEMLAAFATVQSTGALSQGAPASTQIANVICRRLDTRMAGIARKLEAVYTRYVDDLTFSWTTVEKAPFVAARNSAHTVIRAEGFRMHPSKTRTFRAPATVTGYVTGRGTVRPSIESRRNLRAAEHNASVGKGDYDRDMGLWSFCAAVTQ